MSNTENSKNLKSFVNEFNRNVEKKYFLNLTAQDKFTAEEARTRGKFVNLNTLQETLTLLRASYYDEQNIPEALALKVAEAFANTQIRAGNAINVIDCIPKKKIGTDTCAELEKKIPSLHKLYIQNF